MKNKYKKYLSYFFLILGTGLIASESFIISAGVVFVVASGMFLVEYHQNSFGG